MMGLPVLTATARSLLSARRLTLDFMALLLIGVVFFPILSHRGSYVIP